MAELFDLCVGAMYLMSDITGLTYKEINIWLFVIIHPVITLTLFILLIFKQRKINHYEKTYEMEWGQGNSLDDLMIKYKQHLQKTSEDEDEDEDEELRILESIEEERNRYFRTECEIERGKIVDLIKKLSMSLQEEEDVEDLVMPENIQKGIDEYDYQAACLQAELEEAREKDEFFGASK